MTRRNAWVARIAGAVCLATPACYAPVVRQAAAATANERVSVPSGGGQANGGSRAPAISSDGRYVAFESDAGNLDPFASDGNGVADIYRYDRVTHETILVSVAIPRAQVNSAQVRQAAGPPAGNGPSSFPSISADGNVVAFQSTATNLTTNPPGDGRPNVFVRDIAARTTAIATWRYSACGGDPNCIRVPVATSGEHPAISADARWVAYATVGSPMNADGDPDTNGKRDVYVWDRTNSGPNGEPMSVHGPVFGNGDVVDEAPAISANGRFVTFATDATDMLDTGFPSAGVPANANGDSNGVTDVFVHDRDPDGDGAFDTYPRGGPITLVSVRDDGSQFNGASLSPSISGDGGLVAFQSDLVPRRSCATNFNVLVRNLPAKRTAILSLAPDGTAADGESREPDISRDGRTVAWTTNAGNLSPASGQAGRCGPAPNGAARDTVVGRATAGGPVMSVGNAADGGPPNGSSSAPASDVDGGLVAFTSAASNLVPGDTNGQPDDFVSPPVAPPLPPRRPGDPKPPPPPPGVQPPAVKSVRLDVNPALGPGGTVTAVHGSGFTPGANVTLSWDVGLGRQTVVVAADGSFTAAVLVFRRDRLGPRQLIANDGAQQGRATFLVVPSPVEPRRFISRR